jgi:hypothetical protein
MGEIKRYRKRPVVVEAIQWQGPGGGAVDRLEAWGCNVQPGEWYPPMFELVIPTPEGDMSCKVGDWIIKGVEGEFYPCKDSIFQMSYEEASDE